jgi:RNA polymerase sigma-70 factor, ECF subfamily
MSIDKTQIFELHRQTLEGLAYRMLGNLTEAQDAVQETYIKWHKQDDNTLYNYRAWLITVCTRICLNQLKLSYRQREVYVGEWLPEPLFHEFDEGMDAQLEINETLTIAMLHVLEKLSPVERAVFLLHDVFDIKFTEIANIVDKSSANCRQLATRARKHIQSSRPRFSATQDEHRRLLDKFIMAAQACDIDGLVSLLVEDVELYSDGGGKVEALSNMLSGNQSVAKFFLDIFSTYKKEKVFLDIVTKKFNSLFGLLIFENEQLTTTLTIECESGYIRRIFAVRNPDKLLNIPLQ